MAGFTGASPGQTPIIFLEGSESLVPESPLLQFSSAGIHKSNLLETRSMVTPYEGF